MKRSLLAVALFTLATPALAQDKSLSIDFENAAPGKPPEGFTAALTGSGAQPKWTIEEDATSPKGKLTLAQTDTDDTSQRFPLLVHDTFSAKDVAVSVSFKTITGEVDQAAGLVVRYIDKDNYYIARANALEGNVRFYKFEKGKRTQLGGKNIDVPKNQWHTLGLSARGSEFSVTLNGQELFKATDETFKEAGKVGLWTKADSVTRFDGLTVEAK